MEVEGSGREEGVGRSRGPETGREGDRRGSGLGAEQANGGRHRSRRDVRGGGLGPDCRDGRRRTTKDKEAQADRRGEGVAK